MGSMITFCGQRIGRLKAISEPWIEKSGGDSKARSRIEVLCDCGTQKTIRLSHFKNGLTLSCGCLAREQAQRSKTIHGMSNTPTHQTWRAMLGRCNNPNDEKYARYGGRGIKVCQEWHQFSNFFNDMGSRPPRMSIDRINNNGDYSAENCRWATATEQSNNTRRNKLITYQGKTQSLSQWSKEIGIPESAIRKRIALGWTAEKALTTEVIKK